MSRRRNLATALAVSLGTTALAAPLTLAPLTAAQAAPAPRAVTTTAPTGHPVGPGTHDTLFPGYGHGGYDAGHYDVALRYATDGTIRAVTTLTARTRPAGHRLHRFTLDLTGLRVHRILVDGRPAHWRRHGHDLVVAPRQPVRGAFTTRVVYGGTPREITDADGSTEGWVRTADGAIGLGEPLGTMAWVPVNDTPGDKATWRFRVDVPKRLQVAANGDLVAKTHRGPRTVWTWRESDPMTAYLATVAIGRFRLFRSSISSVDGRTLPVWTFVNRGSGDAAAARAKLPDVVAFEEKLFGPYPFTSTGMIVDDAHVGYALETQTRPFFPDSVSALVHEMAHQWYGDSVSVVDWHDLWLAEGFATYAEWLWDDAHGKTTVQQHFDALYAQPASADLWRPAPTRFTSSADLFGDPVYSRGAMTLQALRNRVGDRDFFTILKRWAAVHRHGNAHTTGFVHLAEQVSGKDLGRFFRTWLVRAGKPTGY